MALKIFLSKTPRMVLSDFDNTQTSEPYASTGLVKVFYNFILFFDTQNLNDTKTNSALLMHVCYKAR
jgi:hypothetical protein